MQIIKRGRIIQKQNERNWKRYRMMNKKKKQKVGGKRKENGKKEIIIKKRGNILKEN